MDHHQCASSARDHDPGFVVCRPQVCSVHVMLDRISQLVPGSSQYSNTMLRLILTRGWTTRTQRLRPQHAKLTSSLCLTQSAQRPPRGPA